MVKLIDGNGATQVEYTYDTWGACTTTGAMAGTLGLKNPFRYRGYVYDSDTGLYYLESRYYDPETGRFLSSDTLMSTGQSALGYNMYAYCLNNPVNMSDYNGMLPSWATKILIGVAVITVLAVVTVATAGTGTIVAAVAMGALKGAVTGAAFGAATGAAGGAISHRLNTGSWKGAGQNALEGAANGFLVCTITGAITGGINGGLKHNTSPSRPKYPGDDPTKSPGKGFEWRGRGDPASGNGSWYNPGTGESWHPDLNHGPPIGPHWDYTPSRGAPPIRIFPR